MRTTLDLNDDLMAALLARHPGATKTAAVEAAIRAHLEREASEALRAMAGTLAIDPEVADRSADLRRAEDLDRGWRGDPA